MMKKIEIIKSHLLKEPFEKLANLPHLSLYSCKNGKHNLTATIWHDYISPDEIQLHLQIPSGVFGFLGIGYDYALRLFRDGSWRPLTPEEWVQLEE